jgi:hypothetical protein
MITPVALTTRAEANRRAGGRRQCQRARFDRRHEISGGRRIGCRE